jgi:alcohol dehydrogenase class IV
MNVPQDRFDEFAAEAMSDSSHPSNPRPMTPADYKAVLEAAF